MFKLKSSALVLSLSVAALLSACGGGGGGAAPSLSGVAAVGDPIIGGEVTANCSDGNPYLANPTSSSGAWSIAAVPAAAFPCVVQVSYGGDPKSTLNSYAAGPGVVNITPFTDLILAMAAEDNPSDYFSNVSESNKAELTSEINAAIAKLKKALVTAGYLAAGDSFDPINARFTAAKGNFYDDLLEAFKKGLSDDGGKTYSVFLTSLLANLDADLVLPDAPPKETGGGTTTPGSNTVPANVHSKLVGTYYLKFKQGGGRGCGTTWCSFVEDQDVTVVVGADNTLTIGSLKLTNPINRVYGEAPHLPEIIWVDGDLDYALSNNHDTSSFPAKFNEINLIKRDGVTPPFLGQLRATEVAEDPAAKLSIFEGEYAPKYVYKNSNFTLPNQKGTKPALNTNINVSISDKGVISVGIGSGSEDDDEPLVFDPSDESYTFSDNTESSGSMLPNYVVTYAVDDKTIMSLTMSISDGTIVAWKPERLTNNGGGVYSSAYVLLDEELLKGQDDFIKEFSPDKNIVLTAITDDNTVNKYFKKCDKLSLEISIPSGQAQYRLGLRGYNEATSGYTSNLYVRILGRDSLKFSSFEYPDTLTIKDVRLGKREGIGFIDIDILDVTDLSKVVGKVTNDPAAIDSACPK